MASSALDVELSMAKVMKSLQSSVASMEAPLNNQTDESLKPQKTVSFIDKKESPDNVRMSSSEPNLSTFTPPINIGKASLTYSTEFTPAQPNRYEHTAPNTRFKTEEDKIRATAVVKPVAKLTPPASCSLEFRKVSLKNNCTDAVKQHVDQQPANDAKVEIKRSVGF